MDYEKLLMKEAPTEPTVESVGSSFVEGFGKAVSRPALGLLQIVGVETPSTTTSHAKEGLDSWAETTGSMMGSALTFYATSTAIKSFAPLRNSTMAPIASGAALGFLEPTLGTDRRERFINAARGATTMMIMEKAPAYLRTQGFKGDLIGNLGNVLLTGAAAGAADANLGTLLSERMLADPLTTAHSAASWALVGGAFHVVSLGFKNDNLKACGTDKTKELLLMGSGNNPASYQTRDFLNSLAPFGVRYRQCGVQLPKFMSKFCSAGPDAAPSVIFPDGRKIKGTDFQALAEKLDLHTAPNTDHYRVAIVGGGPAGVQSGINAASELLPTEPVAVIAEVLGGQARYTSSVKNYMGFPDVTGSELMTRGLAGATERGAEIVVNRVTAIENVGGTKVLTLRDGSQIKADSVVLATGMKYNQLEAPGIERLRDRGVFTLADAHEAPGLKGKQVFLVGAGNSAGQAAVNISKFARDVHMVVRGDDLGKSMSEYLIKEIRRHPNITVHTNSTVSGVEGTHQLTGVSMEVKTPGAEPHQLNNLPADAMYVYIGGTPNTGFLGSGFAKDPRGFLLTGTQLHGSPAWTETRPPLPFETSMPGVFAAGDVNAANPQKRIVSAVGDAGKLIGSLHAYLPTVPAMHSAAPTSTLQPQPGRLQFCVRLPTLGVSTLLDFDRRGIHGAPAAVAH